MNYGYIAAALLVVAAGVVFHQKRSKGESEPEAVEPETPEKPEEDIKDLAHYEALLEQINQVSNALKSGVSARDNQRLLQRRGALMMKYEDDRKKAFPGGGGPAPLDEVIES